MNIDFVNTEVSNTLNISVKKVEIINSFYWGKIVEHINSFNPLPINIDYVCVLAPQEFYVNRFIKDCIKKLRNLRDSTKYTLISGKREEYRQKLEERIRGAWKIRKHYKYIR